MKAFSVLYDKPDRIGCTNIILAENEKDISTRLTEKDTGFKNIGGYCEIRSIKEVPLGSVMVSMLSVVELMLLINKK